MNAGEQIEGTAVWPTRQKDYGDCAGRTFGGRARTEADLFFQ
jgi:hypothetical protein